MGFKVTMGIIKMGVVARRNVFDDLVIVLLVVGGRERSGPRQSGEL